MTKTTEAIIVTQWATFGWSAAGILLMLTIALRNPLLAMLALLPTLLAVGLVLGTDGLARGEARHGNGPGRERGARVCRSTTRSTACFNTAANAGFIPSRESLFASYSVTGPGVLLSSLAVAVGFAALRFSEFAPFVNFGTMVGIATAGSTLGNLVLLPACLTLGDRVGRWFRHRWHGHPAAL